MRVTRWGLVGVLVGLIACSSESASESPQSGAGSAGAAVAGASGAAAAGSAGAAGASSAGAAGQGGASGGQAGGPTAGAGGSSAGAGGSAQAGSAQAGSGGQAGAGQSGSAQGGSSGSAQGGSSGSAQAGAGGSGQGGAACQVLLSVPGLAHVSTVEQPKKKFAIKQPGPTSWHRFEVELDVKLTAWTAKQGQYEVFTLLRGDKWVGNAIGYVAFIGPEKRQSVMVTNINLPYAADKDGRRIAKGYAYQENTTYHVRYVYDLPQDLRRLGISVDGNEVTFVEGKMSNLPADPPFTAVEAPAKGFEMLVGGEETDGPDALTLGWEFRDVKVTGCP